VRDVVQGSGREVSGAGGGYAAEGLSMSYRYFNLNIRHEVTTSQKDDAPASHKKKSAAAFWLDEKKMAPIFFGAGRLQSYSKGEFGEWVAPQSKSGVSEFIKMGYSKPEEQEVVQLVTIDDGNVWVYRPAGEIREADQITFRRAKSNELVTDIPKVIPIEHIRTLSIAEVPLVLSSMKVNQSFSRGTFREIDRKREGAYLGNIAAIQYVTDIWEQNFQVDPLDCLSSLEFETLIAKIFEEFGCFVPAYKGGFLKDFDLIIKADKNLRIENIHLNEGVPFCIQLKLRFEKSPELEEWIGSGNGSHIAISLDKEKDLDDLFSNTTIRSCVKGRDWIRSTLLRLPITSRWLEQSLHWLPESRRAIV
jgi:hypothetical protein